MQPEISSVPLGSSSDRDPRREVALPCLQLHVSDPQICSAMFDPSYDIFLDGAVLMFLREGRWSEILPAEEKKRAKQRG